MDKVNELRLCLEKLAPIHDYPVGVFHPYWARKPFNVITEIIKHLSIEGDRIADPFMGSGTVIFSALSENRSVLGSDLNPLAVFMVSTILTLRKQSINARLEIEKFLEEVTDITLNWYRVNDTEMYMERERFHVDGTFEDGCFNLIRSEIVTKQPNNGVWTNRKVLTESVCDYSYQIDEKFINSPLDFSQINLLFNSRIAIPRGATLDHYYTRENKAAINAALSIATREGLSTEVRNLRKLLISSSLPLLRLSDKKASSQWPYWRPKKMLTSRNPVIVMQSRASLMVKLIEWLEHTLPNIESDFTIDCRILEMSCQDLGKQDEEVEKYDLVLTDPPYSDHVPYLEYSALWASILGLRAVEDLYAKEIVRSDAPSRQEDCAEYAQRLCAGFAASSKLLKIGGYLAWFYQDTNISHWCKVWIAAQNSKMLLMDVIPLRKQRRSMKTVTTPEKTLDGDLVCIFKKMENKHNYHQSNYEEAYSNLRNAIDGLTEKDCYFDVYSTIVRTLLLSGDIVVFAKKYRTIKQIIKAIEV